MSEHYPPGDRQRICHAALRSIPHHPTSSRANRGDAASDIGDIIRYVFLHQSYSQTKTGSRAVPRTPLRIKSGTQCLTPDGQPAHPLANLTIRLERLVCCPHTRTYTHDNKPSPANDNNPHQQSAPDQHKHPTLPVQTTDALHCNSHATHQPVRNFRTIPLRTLRSSSRFRPTKPWAAATGRTPTLHRTVHGDASQDRDPLRKIVEDTILGSLASSR